MERNKYNTKLRMEQAHNNNNGKDFLLLHFDALLLLILQKLAKVEFNIKFNLLFILLFS